jgi:tripartite-type tricarboxylate transporter receptor subunit TctC
MTFARTMLRVFAGALAAAAVQSRAQTEAAYPARTVQVVVPWAAGGSVDTMGRAFAQAMGRALGQAFVVVNRDGAAGMIGTAVVANAAPDGYTLSFGPVTPITNASQLTKKPAFGLDSLEYVCQVFENRFSIAVPQAAPYTTMQEFMAAMRANPGRISYGHLGNGSISHLSFEVAIRGQGMQVTGVPYRGEVPVFIDLQANRLDAGVVTVGGALMGARPVRLLAVIAEQRHPGAPNVPTLKELGVPSLLPALNGLMAPRNTPAPVLRKLEEACKVATASAEMKASADTLREQIIHLPRNEFTERVRLDYREKTTLIRDLNLAPD